MRKLPAVPLTKDNFEEEYKIATGLNFITVKWIETQTAKISETYETDEEVEKAKYELYAKLLRNIQLLHDRYVGGELNKYGCFRIFADYDENIIHNEFSESDKLAIGSGQAVPSDLASMLGDIIFDGFDGQYLLADDGEYLLTSEGVRILI